MLFDIDDLQCVVCGGTGFVQTPALWPALIEEWKLSPEEAAYINLQQGLTCVGCRCNLRAMTLALAVLKAFRFPGTFKEWTRITNVRVLEINHAHRLSAYTKNIKNYTLRVYPETDMAFLPHEDGEFDLVLHSDTLEHVVDPGKGLEECRRVLRPKGLLAFTVPIVVGRLSRSRTGHSPSFHGSFGDNQNKYLVHTEFGSDCWENLMRAGFTSVEFVSLKYPAGIAILARH